jgi:Chromo (CHRromatin Organisation MOdifier) domain
MDNAPEFISGLNKQLCRVMGVKQLSITAHTPHQAGQIEKSHHSFAMILSHVVNEAGDDWDLMCPIADFAINSTGATRNAGMTPIFMNTGHDSNINQLRTTNVPLEEVDETVQAWIFRKRKAEEAARVFSGRYALSWKQKYDDNKPAVHYKKDDLVFIRLDVGSKVQHHGFGPYRVIGFKSENERTLLLHIDGDHKDNILEVHEDHCSDKFLPITNEFPVDADYLKYVRKAKLTDTDMEAPVKAGEMDQHVDIRAAHELEKDEFFVDMIVDHKPKKLTKKTKTRRYLVHYEGYDDKDNQYRTEEELEDMAPALLKEYKRTMKLAEFDPTSMAGKVTRSGRTVTLPPAARIDP